MESLILALATLCQINIMNTGYMVQPYDIQMLQRRCVAHALRCIGNKTDKQEVAACLDPDRSWRVEAKCNEGEYTRWGCKAPGCCDKDDCSQTKYCK